MDFAFFKNIKKNTGEKLQYFLDRMHNFFRPMLRGLRSFWIFIEPIRDPLHKYIDASILSSIRIKLALFIGSLIFFTILINSLINVHQQSQILSESYEREAAISRSYISSLMLELDGIAQSLIQVEEFRERVQMQRKKLKRFKRTRTFRRKKRVSLFGFKTKLFGVLGDKRVRFSTDTYYSQYLSDSDIKYLEQKTRERLGKMGKKEVSNSSFKRLQFLARRFVRLNQIVDQLEEKIIIIVEAQKNGKIGRKQKALTRRQKAIRKSAQNVRQSLDRRITRLLARSIKGRIRELGLDMSRFRIQTFPLDAIVASKKFNPTMDTKLFASKSLLNSKLNDPDLQKNLEEVVLTMTGQVSVNARAQATKLSLPKMELMAHYSPHFQNLSSTRRTGVLEGLRKDPDMWQSYLEEEKKLIKKLKNKSWEIKEQINTLKLKRPPIPPYKDKVFKKLYKEYAAMIKQRFKLFNTSKRKYENEEDYRVQVADSIAYLREAALEDRILIRFESSQEADELYQGSEKVRAHQHRKWQYLRNWIYAGRSETPPKWLKRRYKNGMITNSRTEAEKLMWQLDALPLVSSKKLDVIALVLNENFSGIIRTLVNQTEGLAEIRSNRNDSLLTASIITLFAIVLAVFASGFVVDKIRKTIDSAQQVGAGNLDIEFEDGGTDEFGHLTVALNHMVGGLRDREKIKGILGSMIDPVVVKEAMKDMAALKRGMEKPITAFFSDIAGFSTISENLSSVDLAAVLNEYLSAMTEILKQHDGVLDKYIGDAIVGIFNAPVDVKDHVWKAVKASLRMLDKMQHLRETWIKNDSYISEVRQMHFRIGLHTGLAKVGFMGTDALASYTMMGDTVNLAARLEAASKDYGVSFLVSEAVYMHVKEKVLARKVDLVRVKGKNEPVVIYEIISDSKKVPANIQKAAKLYEEGFELYLNQNWKKAAVKMKASEKEKGTKDKAVRMLLDRMKHYYQVEPPKDWDGVYTRETK